MYRDEVHSVIVDSDRSPESFREAGMGRCADCRFLRSNGRCAGDNTVAIVHVWRRCGDYHDKSRPAPPPDYQFKLNLPRGPRVGFNEEKEPE